MSELATSRSDVKEATPTNQEVTPGEDLGQADIAGFSPGKSFNPKLSGSNQVPLNRENVMRLQRVIGNQAVMRLIATQKQASPAPVSPTTIQRKIQVDLDQFKGLSHFGNQLLNTTFVQIKSKYKAYLKTNDPAKETKLIGDLLKLCDQWMINHAALQKNKDTKKLEVITNLKLAIAEEAATKQQVVTDKSGKKVTFDPKGATVIKPQPPVSPPPTPLQGVGKVGAPGGSPIPGPEATQTDVPQGGGGMSDALGYREDIEPDTNIPQTGGGMSDALGYREDIQADDSSGGSGASSGTPQNNLASPPQSQGGGGMGDGLEARAEVEAEAETETEEDSGQGQGGGGGQVGNLDPRMELIKRIGFPPAYIQSLGQPDFDLLVKADKALDDGDVVEADKSFALLRTSLSGVVNMLKGFLMRYHMGNIHPELSKMMDDPDFVATSDQAQKAQDHVNDLGKKFFATGKTGNTDYKDVSGAVDKKQQNTVDPKFAGLTLQEATAIVGYLSDLYPNYNNPLRMGIGQSTGDNAFGEQAFNLTATAISALNKLRPHSGLVFRHSGIFPGYLEVNQVGAVIPDMAFMSSAKHQSGTQGGENHDSLEVILETKSGKDMEHAAWFGGESEILFKPGTRFRVLARLDLTRMPGGQWPTDSQASGMGLSANELILIQYVNSDDKRDRLKHLILKREA